MIREPFQYRETFAVILAENPAHAEAAKQGMIAARQVLEAYIARDPFFASTFFPYEPETDETLILHMAKAAARAGVGPMATVAGAIAAAGIDAMVAAGAGFGVIDNGGDIALVSDREVRVGVHAGCAPVSDRIAFVVPKKERPFGICTSSATVGPSVSFGMADAVTIFARDPLDADAWATAVCNRIRPDDRQVLATIDRQRVEGVYTIMGETIVAWGEVPPVVPARVDEQLIAAGDRL
ncbi:UPF0280 family protein [Methanoregula sp.]|uniref:UPF0280 family protein n=1 Tax=Methanoregula sp. TaxID=2052170 RepID=UPI002C71A489|nr:UPF0280 family protein [Methanoregula sp.]HVP96056.1 UPF0280 family protein [Methanoregula sp.]